MVFVIISIVLPGHILCGCHYIIQTAATMKKATTQLCYVQNTASEKDNFKLRLTQNQYFILEEAIFNNLEN